MMKINISWGYFLNHLLKCLIFKKVLFPFIKIIEAWIWNTLYDRFISFWKNIVNVIFGNIVISKLMNWLDCHCSLFNLFIELVKSNFTKFVCIILQKFHPSNWEQVSQACIHMLIINCIVRVAIGSIRWAGSVRGCQSPCVKCRQIHIMKQGATLACFYEHY